MAKVASVSLDRLHNLGNYEHLKFSVRVDLDEDDNAGQVIHNLERMLGALAPVERDYAIESAVEFLSNPENADADPEKIALRKQIVAKHEAKVARRRAALQAFDDLGGISTHTDAKEKWEDQDQDDYDY